MTRIAVALYLVVVTAAGPLACCCTLTRLATKLSLKTTRATEPAETHSCCKHKAPRSSSPGEREQHAPARSDCPCKQGGDCSSHALATSHDESRDDTLRALAGTVASLFAPELSHHAGVVHSALPSSGAPRGGASLSKDEILHVFHILRC